ncbi:MAG: hypothetical protein KKB21_00615 [Nanoarchaeota archaeon]|nr:hypothetical protein [Nanoarchaeota archaeon]MBU4086057.1 hypothetical protein [Nanoarchaeota archaeon]
MATDGVRESLERLFRGIRGIELNCDSAENYVVRCNGGDVAVIHDLPKEEFRMAFVLERSAVSRESLAVYDKLVRRLKYENYHVHRANDLDVCHRVVT